VDRAVGRSRDSSCRATMLKSTANSMEDASFEFANLGHPWCRMWSWFRWLKSSATLRHSRHLCMRTAAVTALLCKLPMSSILLRSKMPGPRT